MLDYFFKAFESVYSQLFLYFKYMFYSFLVGFSETRIYDN
jgi:hypothetical protein